MENHSINMDFQVKHWGPFPRHFPSTFPVITAEFVPAKDRWVRRVFDTCNFSLILRGRGEFRRNGKIWAVQAPCVITQWPGEYVEYGPPVPEETWDELYIIYDAKLMAGFQECRLVEMERPVWPIADLKTVLSQIDQLESLANSPTPESVVDQVDRVCERLVLSTCLRPNVTVEGDPAIEAVLSEARRNLARTFDLKDIAARHGMSVSTFQRRWAAVNKTPPARYLQQLRIREACRLLVETMHPVYQIAFQVGFTDPLYFSRRFHEQLQITPSQYRKAYSMRRSEAEWN